MDTKWRRDDDKFSMYYAAGALREVGASLGGEGSSHSKYVIREGGDSYVSPALL